MKWLSFDEVKPIGGQMILVATIHGVGCAKYDAYEGALKQLMIPGNVQYYHNGDATHWMPLPEPPDTN